MPACHQESFDDVATVGQVHSDDGGFTWVHDGTILYGTNLRSTGFRGAGVPSVSRTETQYVAVFENRPGDGVHGDIRVAWTWIEPNGEPGHTWTNSGPIVGEDGRAPHYFANAPTLRWMDEWSSWAIFYSTDSAFRYVIVHPTFSQTSAPTAILTKPAEWLQSSGYYRWYLGFRDDTQDNSCVVGGEAWMSEHRVNVEDHGDRFPAISRWTIR